MRNGIIACVAAAIGVLAIPACRRQRHLPGASVGQAAGIGKLQEPPQLRRDSTGFKIIGGWRFLDWLSVEDYVDLGSATTRCRTKRRT
jgi:hypothetical protein